jgi:hypothetical protein
MTSSTVQVRLNRHGDWDVALPDGAVVTCETLAEARRVAYLSAAHRHPCEPSAERHGGTTTITGGSR